MTFLRDLARLAVPVECPGCGRPDVRWCADCATAVVGSPPYRVESGAPRLDRMDGVAPLPTWALSDYAGAVRDVVVAWKDRMRVDLDALLAPAVRRAAAQLAVELGTVAAGGPVGVVPAPSAPFSRQRRGREPVHVLARAVMAGLRDEGLAGELMPVLRRRGRARDQVGLGARARGRNLASSLVVRRRARDGRPPGGSGPVLLVDDILTTGATLAAAERALSGVGIAVVGAFVLSATPSPDPSTGSSQPGSPPAVHPADTLGLA